MDECRSRRLPVLIQMALNISTIVTTLQSGQQISAAEAAAIQNISAQPVIIKI
jgi:hypothetical protein